MSTKRQTQKAIQVCAHWQGLEKPLIMGTLFVANSRGKEIFSFEYDRSWLKSPFAQTLDPDLSLFSGPQYAPEGRDNFGVFLDSSPDRWGRVLMQLREAQLAKTKSREVQTLKGSDYLLGVYDLHRMGALRFRMSEGGPFLDDQADLATPPWARLRDLEYASQQIEREDAENDKNYVSWLKMLIAPGGSLGGARPKASVTDERGHPWIAKFPSLRDEINVAKWEYLVFKLALRAGVETAPSELRNFSGVHDTFLSQRFDRTASGERIHFASAMSLLGKQDGDGADTGVSYLDLAEFLVKNGAQVNSDLEQLWRRIVFYICVSNTDDHLRNHGFLLQQRGWVLSPAYDMNPTASASGLSLNISRHDNSKSFELARSVAPVFRIKSDQAQKIIGEVAGAVSGWLELAKELRFSAREVSAMRPAFEIVDEN